jgi:Tfp pilus assembly protein FimV
VTALILGGIVAAPQAFADGSDEPVAFDTYTVIPGESLWSIAGAHTPEGEDVRAVVSDIQELNDMDGSSLQSGEQIRVPVLDS